MIRLTNGRRRADEDYQFARLRFYEGLFIGLLFSLFPFILTFCGGPG